MHDTLRELMRITFDSDEEDVAAFWVRAHCTHYALDMAEDENGEQSLLAAAPLSRCPSSDTRSQTPRTELRKELLKPSLHRTGGYPEETL